MYYALYVIYYILHIIYCIIYITYCILYITYYILYIIYLVFIIYYILNCIIKQYHSKTCSNPTEKCLKLSQILKGSDDMNNRNE